MNPGDLGSLVYIAIAVAIGVAFTLMRGGGSVQKAFARTYGLAPGEGVEAAWSAHAAPGSAFFTDFVGRGRGLRAGAALSLAITTHGALVLAFPSRQPLRFSREDPPTLRPTHKPSRERLGNEGPLTLVEVTLPETQGRCWPPFELSMSASCLDGLRAWGCR